MKPTGHPDTPKKQPVQGRKVSSGMSGYKNPQRCPEPSNIEPLAVSRINPTLQMPAPDLEAVAQIENRSTLLPYFDQPNLTTTLGSTHSL